MFQFCTLSEIKASGLSINAREIQLGRKEDKDSLFSGQNNQYFIDLEAGEYIVIADPSFASGDLDLEITISFSSNFTENITIVNEGGREETEKASLTLSDSQRVYIQIRAIEGGGFYSLIVKKPSDPLFGPIAEIFSNPVAALYIIYSIPFIVCFIIAIVGYVRKARKGQKVSISDSTPASTSQKVTDFKEEALYTKSSQELITQRVSFFCQIDNEQHPSSKSAYKCVKCSRMICRDCYFNISQVGVASCPYCKGNLIKAQ